MSTTLVKTLWGIFCSIGEGLTTQLSHLDKTSGIHVVLVRYTMWYLYGHLCFVSCHHSEWYEGHSTLPVET